MASVANLPMLPSCERAIPTQGVRAALHRNSIHSPHVALGKGLGCRWPRCHECHPLQTERQVRFSAKRKCRAVPTEKIGSIWDISRAKASVLAVFPPNVWSPVFYGLVEVLGTILLAATAVWAIRRLARMNREGLWEDELLPAHKMRQEKLMETLQFFFQPAAGPLSVLLVIGAALRVGRVAATTADKLLQLSKTGTGIPVDWENLLQKSILALQAFDDVAIKVTQFLTILFGVWVVVGLKNQYVSKFMQRSRAQPFEVLELRRMVLPLNALATWGLVAVGAMTALQIFGVNIQPFLAVGGVSGLVIGLAAQSVVANLISGINLFLSRPFVVGDRVEVFTTGGGRVLGGVISHINPLRTCIQTDKHYPVMIPNKVLTEMVLGNESRGEEESTITVSGGRRVACAISMDFEDLDQVKTIINSLRKFINEFEGVDKGMPRIVAISGLKDSTISLNLQVTTDKEHSTNLTEFQLKLLRDVKGVLKDKGMEGAKLAM